jgi:hypothetical protein
MGCDALDIDFSNNSHNETSTTFFEGNDTSYNATVTDNLPPSGASLPPFVFPASFRNETDNERFPRSAETAPPSCIRKFGKLKIDVPESLTCPTQYPGSGTVFSVSHYDLPNNGTEETARLGADAKAKYPFVEQSTYEEARRLNPGWSGKEILDMLCKKVTAWTLEIKNDGGLKSKIKFFNNKVDSHKGIGCKRVNTVGPAEKFIARKHRKIYGMQETSVKVETHGGRTHIAAEGWRTT